MPIPNILRIGSKTKGVAKKILKDKERFQPKRTGKKNPGKTV